MNFISLDIEFLALQRIAAIFNVPAENLRPEWVFGGQLKSSFQSDFIRNEFDVISDDIHDVADKATLRLMDSGQLVISTVGEYCDFMVKLSHENAQGVKHVLTSKNGFDT